MIAPNLILTILMQLPVCYGETKDINRLEVISNAISCVSNDVNDVAALLTIGTFESSWCKSVGEGKRRGGKGIGYWQIEPGSNRTKPFAGLSLEDTTHAAGEALWIWHHSYQCGSAMNSRFTAYAGLKCIKWSGAEKRTKFYNWVSWQLNK
jgi:hypothetical protein